MSPKTRDWIVIDTNYRLTYNPSYASYLQGYTTLTSQEIRQAFLEFFESKNHLRMPSSPLIPAGDPPLLLTNAGMVQFKPYFTGEMTPPSNRMTSVQK